MKFDWFIAVDDVVFKLFESKYLNNNLHHLIKLQILPFSPFQNLFFGRLWKKFGLVSRPKFFGAASIEVSGRSVIDKRWAFEELWAVLLILSDAFWFDWRGSSNRTSLRQWFQNGHLKWRILENCSSRSQCRSSSVGKGPELRSQLNWSEYPIW